MIIAITAEQAQTIPNVKVIELYSSHLGEDAIGIEDALDVVKSTNGGGIMVTGTHEASSRASHPTGSQLNEYWIAFTTALYEHGAEHDVILVDPPQSLMGMVN